MSRAETGKLVGIEAGRWKGISVEEAYRRVEGVVTEAWESHPNLGVVKRYRLIADLLPGRVDEKLQRQLVRIIKSRKASPEDRSRAQATFLMLSLKSVLSQAEHYFNGDPERDEDILDAGMLGLIERLPRLRPWSALTAFIHKAVEEGIIEFRVQNEGAVSSLMRRGVEERVRRVVDRQVAGSPLGMSPWRVRGLAESLVKGGSLGSDSGGSNAVMDYIERQLAPLSVDDPGRRQVNVEENVELKLLKRELLGVMGSLPERDQNVLQWRYWDGLTLDEVAERLGVSRARVWQIEARALSRLRVPRRRRRLRGY